MECAFSMEDDVNRQVQHLSRDVEHFSFAMRVEIERRNSCARGVPTLCAGTTPTWVSVHTSMPFLASLVAAEPRLLVICDPVHPAGRIGVSMSAHRSSVHNAYPQDVSRVTVTHVSVTMT